MNRTVGIALAVIAIICLAVLGYVVVSQNKTVNALYASVSEMSTQQAGSNQESGPTATPMAEEAEASADKAEPTEPATEYVVAPPPVINRRPVVIVEEGFNSPADGTVYGLPTGLTVASYPEEYVNTMGGGSEHWIFEPGVRTAIPGDPTCDPQHSCWYISPDVQHKLTDLVGEGLDLREDGYLMCAFARGKFAFGNGVTFVFEPLEKHSWLFIMRGLAPGDGDRNLRVTVTDYDPAYMTCTNLPAGVGVSEDYVLQNLANIYDNLCGAIDHCTSADLTFYGAEDQTVWNAYQGGRDEDLYLDLSNFTIAH